MGVVRGARVARVVSIELTQAVICETNDNHEKDYARSCASKSPRRAVTRRNSAGVRKNPGAVAMNPSRPSQNDESVSCRTSHPCATACIHVPTLERKAPIQKMR